MRHRALTYCLTCVFHPPTHPGCVAQTARLSALGILIEFAKAGPEILVEFLNEQCGAWTWIEAL